MKKTSLSISTSVFARFKHTLSALWQRISRPINRLGVRSRVFVYFLAFTVALLILLWVFQIAFLSDFYQLQKTNMLTTTLDTLANNIDNTDLQLLADRLSEANDVCVLIVNDHTEQVVSSETLGDCVIHRMSGFDLNRYIQMTDSNSSAVYRIFSMGGFGTSEYNESRFNGHVPPADNGHSKSHKWRDLP